MDTLPIDLIIDRSQRRQLSGRGAARGEIDAVSAWAAWKKRAQLCARA